MASERDAERGDRDSRQGAAPPRCSERRCSRSNARSHQACSSSRDMLVCVLREVDMPPLARVAHAGSDPAAGSPLDLERFRPARAQAAPFGEVEADGGRDILRAAEVTPDPLLRRLYLDHAIDELHHGDLFRQRGAALLQHAFRASRHALQRNCASRRPWARRPAVQDEPDDRLLAFLHVAEKAAAGRFTIYRDVVDDDPSDARRVRRDPARRSLPHELHLHAAGPHPAAGRTGGRCGWRARAGCGNATCGWRSRSPSVLGTAVLTISYFVLLPPFAWLAKRAARREQPGLGADRARTTQRVADEPVLR